MFEGLAFDPFLQIASEPYHLLFLGILKFFFKRIIKEKLKPYQRDQVNFLIQQFIFPPSIRFDVTTDTKNFSITTMQAIGSAFVYVLNQLDVGDELVLFWAKLNGTVQQIFGPLNKEAVKNIQTNFLDLLKQSKQLIPSVLNKRPQNIHNLIEFLCVDLEIWMNISARWNQGAKTSDLQGRRFVYESL